MDLQLVVNKLFKSNLTKIHNPGHLTTEYFQTLTNFVLCNNYIQYYNQIYIQSTGIPQGGTASSILADLYLYSYEQKIKNKKTNTHIFRYIDDILTLNLEIPNTDFEFPIKYPRNIELIKNKSKNNIVNFLDLSIKINKKHHLNFEIYDKRLDFPFKVNSFTHFTSCIHKSVYRNITVNHLIRIKRLTHKKHHHKYIQHLIDTALDYCYPYKFINDIASKMSITIQPMKG